MDLNRIINERRRDLGPNTDVLFCHMTIGMCEEVGEVAGLLKRKFKGVDVARITWMEELGDVFWYLVNVADMLGISMEELVEHNRIKLAGRYKDE